MQPRRFVAYYRVSTARQGRSGLGLDAQRRMVTDFLNGGSWELVGEFTEVESGKRSDRPQLAAAIAACKKEKATLVIAKLDRLARNVHFVSGLMESGVDFVAVDMPEANRLTIHILAAVAEHEREMISRRTKDALAAAKERGRRLGFANERRRDGEKARQRSLQVRKQKAAQFAANVRPIIEAIRQSGVTSLRGIAGALNARGIRAPRGGEWSAASVRHVLQQSHDSAIA